MHTHDLQVQRFPQVSRAMSLQPHTTRSPCEGCEGLSLLTALSLRPPCSRWSSHRSEGLGDSLPSAECPGASQSHWALAPGKPGTLLGASGTSALVPSSVRWPCNPSQPALVYPARWMEARVGRWRAPGGRAGSVHWGPGWCLEESRLLGPPARCGRCCVNGSEPVLVVFP